MQNLTSVDSKLAALPKLESHVVVIPDLLSFVFLFTLHIDASTDNDASAIYDVITKHIKIHPSNDKMSNWEKRVVSVVMQLEKASTYHIQGAVLLRDAETQKEVGTLVRGNHCDIFKNWFWTKAKGSWEQNINYCSKDETRVYGTLPRIIHFRRIYHPKKYFYFNEKKRNSKLIQLCERDCNCESCVLK